MGKNRCYKMPQQKEKRIKTFDAVGLTHRITDLFVKWIVKRDKGNCQILFPITELDSLVAKIIKEIKKKV